jgi:Holliday junction resolvasome RuvABC endonuclease subunit
MNVVKVLASFLGVAKKICYEYHKTEPLLIRRTHVLKQTMGNGDASKEDVVKYIEDFFDVILPKEGTEDIADAILTGYCYILESRLHIEGGEDGKK